jgi:hypothetical protein
VSDVLQVHSPLHGRPRFRGFRCGRHALARIERDEDVTEFVSLGEQLLASLLDVMADAIDQLVRFQSSG